MLVDLCAYEHPCVQDPQRRRAPRERTPHTKPPSQVNDAYVSTALAQGASSSGLGEGRSVWFEGRAVIERGRPRRGFAVLDRADEACIEIAVIAARLQAAPAVATAS